MKFQYNEQSNGLKSAHIYTWEIEGRCDRKWEKEIATRVNDDKFGYIFKLNRKVFVTIVNEWKLMCEPREIQW